MTDHSSRLEYALAIRALDPEHGVPVVYDLTRASTDIGSAEDNHIVLSGPGVEPYHLTIRQIGKQLYALVDRGAAESRGESAWLDVHQGDRFYCAAHGQLRRLSEAGCCPHCKARTQPLWLLRPVDAGDAFPIGSGFEASVLSQGQPNPAGGEGIAQASPWPETRWLETAPRPPTITLDPEGGPPAIRPYPLEDSNLWMWCPPESPIPVFIHQRVNRFCTWHAWENRDREVGGLLLGQVYRDAQDGIAYPVITHALAARFAGEHRGHLTFTHETWVDLNRQREATHPGRQVVGWYHTHPGLDIFLSQMDLFIHRNFFREPWQVALVIDPRQDAAGFFVWQDGEILDPQRPYQLFKIADLEDETRGERRPRVRIKLGERVP